VFNVERKMVAMMALSLMIAAADALRWRRGSEDFADPAGERVEHFAEQPEPLACFGSQKAKRSLKNFFWRLTNSEVVSRFYEGLTFPELCSCRTGNWN
jgi:hypothetical protein